MTELYRELEDALAALLPDNDYDLTRPAQSNDERDRSRLQAPVVTTIDNDARDSETRGTLTPAPDASWHRVTIQDNEVADLTARGLMAEFVMAHLAHVVQHGLPSDVGVYHDADGETGHVYYFSPQASLIGTDVLRGYSATTCPEPHNLTAFQKQKF